ncbi:IS1182 family transposase [Mycobacterium avium]|uniref:IS1182 family transposase n=1 Tax=Mycobacterium avium TaxID=1764 RepID=UPI00044FD9FB|nr:IS1182 family transposase [Mycobacterium avium]ETZ37181.1 transposase DDE domain protein [Mycobacterium avium MAV_120809_2495]MCA4734143.1 IS1182 family transposase [Mycobacterium avium subsp. hominissuis]MCA4739123.1 IS1182 family transposase [Mycobacterium avium subsp. hominissuis]MCA4743181.1 IS1182 family transposase [Mycobacterium avium subsp. hominissuis]MCA4763337.1 IS1182 family transposase [Mycobacterium avium subsp. hominissuis]
MQGRSDDQRELLDAESVAGHLLKADSMFAFLAAHRSQLFPEEMFADLFPSQRGRPSVPAEVMASVITLQALHGFSDNETVDAVTFDLRWKAACGLPITAGAFHSTTLTYWRRRLAASDRPNRIFEAVKTVVAETGVLAGKTRRALDSTVLDDAVATQDTVTQLIAAIRRVRREVPGAAAVIEAHCSAHDYDDPGKPAIAWEDKAARDRLVDGLVGDAHRVLGYLPDQELAPRAAEAVALLALIAGQDVEPVEGSDGTDGHWRIAQQVSGDRVISTVDADTRHAHKTVHRRQDGFKAHLAVEPDTGIITDCALTKASGADNHEAVVGLSLLEGEHTPVRVLGDSAYGTGAARAALADAGHVAVIKPLPLRPPVPGGFTSDDFLIDFDARIVTCPAGHGMPIRPSGGVTFERYCRSCPLASRCTTATRGRKLTLHIHEQLLRAARVAARDPDWQTEYRQHRPMVERSMAWLTRGNRKVRYRGTAKNNHWLHHRAAALNLRRLLTMGLTRTDTTWAIA